jgi:hypothetical protein
MIRGQIVKRLIAWTLIVLVSVVVFAASYSQFTRGVMVVVSNGMSADIQDVELHFTGGMRHVGMVQPGSEVSVRVRPTGDSGLELRYVDSLGIQHKEAIGVYFDGENFRGSIDIQIHSDGTVTFVDSSYIGLF